MISGIIICCRHSSSRIPGKAVKEFNGLPLLYHLVQRITQTKLPIVIAYPAEDFEKMRYALHLCKQFENVSFYESHGFENESPLHRMYSAALSAGFDKIVRLTTDKIFVDPNEITEALETDQDYLFCPKNTPGTGFEVIGFNSLQDARREFSDQPVEHISYAIRAVAKVIRPFVPKNNYHREDYRLLIDFKEDCDLIELLLSTLKSDATPNRVIKFLNEHPWALGINRCPLISVYTCARNSDSFIRECMQSVKNQDIFHKCEYILIDDFSDDLTFYQMALFAQGNPEVKLVRNEKNLGLAASSNVALETAKGKYIIRIDSDDYFSFSTSISELLHEAQRKDYDAVYPDNYHGSRLLRQRGDKEHHIGGSLFKRSAINHIKFNNSLRGLDGYDFYERSYKQFRIGYLERPLFFYRQHQGSMSKNNMEYRSRIKAEIDFRLKGENDPGRN